jgi:hypothetical protein
MASLDSFLNTAMPIAVILFFVGLIYWKLREPFHAFGIFLKNIFSSASQNMPNVNAPSEIIYR